MRSSDTARPAFRIACIQHGDFRSARALMNSSSDEPYFGMRESVRALENLLSPHDSLIISIDSQPYRDHCGSMEMVGLPMSKHVARVPRLCWKLWARQILREVERFRPTHLLLRVGGDIALNISRWCVQHRVPTLVVLANAVWGENRRMRRTNRQLMATLCHPVFSKVYNYKPTACMSMRDQGLLPEKIFAYEFGGERHPDKLAPKTHADQTDCRLVFAARMVKAKGPLDVIHAIRHLLEMGIPARATMFGTGEVLAEAKQLAASLPTGVVEFPGWVDNDVLFDSLRRASFACVPTHPSFMEGMPMSLTEALASRTPVIASDCEVFARSFRDGEGVRLFRAEDSKHLAQVVAEVYRHPAQYDALSESTEAAFRRVSAGKSFEEVLEQWSCELTNRVGVPR
jgi:glycosyltransferase involved in cell wall biosynthesis